MDNQVPNRDCGQRERILEAAAEVFAEQGLAGARVDEIARRAEVNKAMLYYHVGNKAALYQAVLVRNFDLLKAEIDEKVKDRETPDEKLSAFIEALVTALGALDYHPRIMMRELSSGGQNMTPEVFAKLVSIFETLRSILDQGINIGEFRPTSPLLTHLTIVASAIMATMTRPMLDCNAKLVPPEALKTLDWTENDLAQHITDLLKHGLVGGEHEC